MSREDAGEVIGEESRENVKYSPIEERDITLSVNGEPRECHIRSYLPEDKELIDTFIRSMSEDDLYMRYPCMATRDRHVENAHKRLTSVLVDHFGVVALVDGKIISIVQAFEYGKDAFEVSLSTQGEFRGSGISKTLFTIIEEKIRESGRSKVVVEFKKRNEPMKNFAKKNGFDYADTDDDMFMYTKDFSDMEKRAA